MIEINEENYIENEARKNLLEDHDIAETEQNNLTDASILSSKVKPRSSMVRSIIVEDFDNMSFRKFNRLSRKNPGIINESVSGPGSAKHPSWEGSLDVPSPWVKISIYAVVVSLIGVGIGLSLGFGVDGCKLACALISGVSFPLLFFLISLITLIIYMSCYGNGLKNPPMPTCINKCGFPCNLQSNVVCRSLLTCCYNPCNCGLVGCVMSREAEERIKMIEELDPNGGGVFWLGDSEFTYWLKLEEDMSAFSNNHINAGFGGSRTIDLQQHVNEICLDWNPATVIVHASGNDFDFDPDLTAKECADCLIVLFETLANHPSVQRLGYFLSSRRPIYTDTKWDFMIRVHSLTIEYIQLNPKLSSIVKTLDLRSMIHPLDDFLPSDRSHLNEKGHNEKSKQLLPIMLKTWPEAQT